jgi:hypothetical protein
MKDRVLTPAEEFERSRKRVYEAHNALLTKLFGSVPDQPYKHEVTRKVYKQAMEEVKKEFGLEEGDPDLVLFVLEQLSRSPRFSDEEQEG